MQSYNECAPRTRSVRLSLSLRNSASLSDTQHVDISAFVFLCRAPVFLRDFSQTTCCYSPIFVTSESWVWTNRLLINPIKGLQAGVQWKQAGDLWDLNFWNHKKATLGFMLKHRGLQRDDNLPFCLSHPLPPSKFIGPFICFYVSTVGIQYYISYNSFTCTIWWFDIFIPHSMITPLRLVIISHHANITIMLTLLSTRFF